MGEIAGLQLIRPEGHRSSHNRRVNLAMRLVGENENFVRIRDTEWRKIDDLSLSPIPELKPTDQGLVDAVNLKLTSVIAD